MCKNQINTLKHIYNDIEEVPKEDINRIPDAVFPLISKQTVQIFDMNDKKLSAGILSIGKTLNSNLRILITSLEYPHNVSVYPLGNIVATGGDNIYIKFDYCVNCKECAKCSS